MDLLDNLQKIREMLSDESRWNKEYYALGSDGKPVNIMNEDACSWCLAGAIHIVCPVSEQYGEVISHLKQFIDGKVISSFNDSPDTTYSDIVGLLNKSISSLS